MQNCRRNIADEAGLIVLVVVWWTNEGPQISEGNKMTMEETKFREEIK